MSRKLRKRLRLCRKMIHSAVWLYILLASLLVTIILHELLLCDQISDALQ